MITITILTTESDEPAKFDVDYTLADSCVRMLSDPNAVLALPHARGGTAHIPVRHITFLHVPEQRPWSDPDIPEIRDPSKEY